MTMPVLCLMTVALLLWPRALRQTFRREAGVGQFGTGIPHAIRAPRGTGIRVRLETLGIGCRCHRAFRESQGRRLVRLGEVIRCWARSSLRSASIGKTETSN